MPLDAGKPFVPHALLKNGHAMPIAAHFWLRRFALPPAEDRHFQVDADSRLLGHCHWQQGKDTSTPLMVLVHGLEGSSDSKYMLGIAEKVWQRGFHVVRMTQRNNYFYQRRFVLGLNARYARKVELFPERYSRNGFAPIRTVREFDDAIT